MTTEAIDDAPDPGARARSQHRVVGSYRLLQPLGEGGMGVVHLALDRQGRAVAIKLLRPHLDADAGARSRLAREVDALRRIRSEHVAPIVDAELDGPEPFMVTRWVDGDALDEHVEAHGPLDRVALHRLAAGMAGAIEAIHAAGVVHRDVKPGNVLLQDGEPVLIDFGIAHLTDDVRLTQTGLVMGTPGYLAPEIIEGGQVTQATDWWGWAATLAYAACGRPPYGRGAMDAVLARVSRGFQAFNFYLTEALALEGKVDRFGPPPFAEIRLTPANTGAISYAEGDVDIEDMIADQQMVISITHSGYVKRLPLAMKLCRCEIGDQVPNVF